MDPLGQRLFQEIPRLQCTRSVTSKDIGLPVPGHPTLSTNIMARLWNEVPGLQDSSTVQWGLPNYLLSFRHEDPNTIQKVF